MATPDRVAREVVVFGRVQGVAFRARCEQEADRRGLGGWVANEPDGSVRAWFEGDRADVDTMVAWCRHGPPAAVVDHVDVVEREPSGTGRFVVR
jgi:acylphosphatase